jgi:glycosyltransferase involved in cell wall biosynthesis
VGWYVAQLGSRVRYSAPRGLARHASLERFYTDAWCRLPPRLVARFPYRLDRYAHRHAPDVPAVTSFELRMGVARLAARFGPAGAEPNAYQRECLSLGRTFATLVSRDLQRRDLDPAGDALFAAAPGALECLAQVRDRGVPGIVNQLDPTSVDIREIMTERSRWAGWESGHLTVHEESAARQRAEWHSAAAVVVNSPWSRAAAVAAGCPAGKVFVVPLAYEPARGVLPALGNAAHRNTDSRLSVLWLGQVILRKGIPYLLEAARLLPRVDFVVAGDIGVDEAALRRAAPANVRVLGRVSEPDADRLRASAHVFVLPTLSDGFALTQLEAMAAGLPVIATNRCGEVVADGEDGLVVPARDAPALADAISRLDDDRGLLRELSRRAVIKAGQFTLERYVDDLRGVLRAVAPDHALAAVERTPSRVEN